VGLRLYRRNYPGVVPSLFCFLLLATRPVHAPKTLSGLIARRPRSPPRTWFLKAGASTRRSVPPSLKGTGGSKRYVSGRRWATINAFGPRLLDRVDGLMTFAPGGQAPKLPAFGGPKTRPEGFQASYKIHNTRPQQVKATTRNALAARPNKTTVFPVFNSSPPRQGAKTFGNQWFLWPQRRPAGLVKDSQQSVPGKHRPQNHGRALGGCYPFLGIGKRMTS